MQFSIDSVESFTGIDFFPALDDKTEFDVERNLCTICWNWEAKGPSYSSSSSSGGTAVQCEGTTKSGVRCKNKTTNASGYCYIHESTQGPNATQQKRRTTSVQCSGTTKKGTRCKRMTLSPNGRCYQHGGN
jgi:endonuclease G